MTTGDQLTPSVRHHADPRHALTIALHLVRRELLVTNALSVVGAGWPLLRQLAQLAVLVIVFSKLLPLGIENYGVFVFSGLIGWSWFSSALSGAASSSQTFRSLALRPRFPTYVLPVVATTVPFVDVLVALPVLLVMLIAVGEVHATAPLLIPLLAVQGLLGLGLGWIVAAISVFLRDVPHIVGVALLLGFYVTPVYFDVSRVPDEYQWIVLLNPLAVLLEADRAALLGTPWPPAGLLAGVIVFSTVLAAVGLVVFRRLAPSFADEL